jgi:hypothetical protein
MARRKNESAKQPQPGAAQTSSTRGSSSQGGPERVAGDSARDDDPIRGPLPEGTQREDYVGGRRPHKTRRPGPTSGASGGRNEVI